MLVRVHAKVRDRCRVRGTTGSGGGVRRMPLWMVGRGVVSGRQPAPIGGQGVRGGESGGGGELGLGSRRDTAGFGIPWRVKEGRR